ncbi:hypothetical protein Barb4_02034 [Bacteroidales bacterium Barb4]|nr:hypothetical protein Barb4_02034 [Bacteroidales bacterium Barb4]
MESALFLCSNVIDVSECGVTERVTLWSPARTTDFSPTCSAAECGVNKDTADNGVLKGRYKLQMMVYNAILYSVVLSGLHRVALSANPTSLNPTFRKPHIPHPLHVGLKSVVLAGLPHISHIPLCILFLLLNPK